MSDWESVRCPDCNEQLKFGNKAAGCVSHEKYAQVYEESRTEMAEAVKDLVASHTGNRYEGSLAVTIMTLIWWARESVRKEQEGCGACP